MEWLEVESSAIAALGNDANLHCLGIEYPDRRQVYLYFEVLSSEFEAFLAAESKGRYLTLIFLPKRYPYTGPYPNRRKAAKALPTGA